MFPSPNLVQPGVSLDGLAGVWPAVLVVVEFGFQLLVATWVLLRRPRYRSSTLTWVLIVLAVPVLGSLAYLAFGEVRIGRRRRERYVALREKLHAMAATHWAGTPYPRLDAFYRPLATLAESVVDTVPRDGNTVRLIGDTDETVDNVIRDIDSAKDHCHLLFYIYREDNTGRRVSAALERAAARGVACRLLVDAVGSRAFLNGALISSLRLAGVRVVEALPASLLRAVFARLDLRNHRKLVILDGKVGYTGSQNIADADYAPREKYAPWVDAMIRVEGPAVRDLQEIFIVDWYQDTRELLEDLLKQPYVAGAGQTPLHVMATGPGSVNEAMAQILLAGLYLAREEVIMTTPYFVPDEATVTAMISAARRGVETILIVPAVNDSWLVQLASRSYYQELLMAGVKIYEYTEGLLHAKTMTVDRKLALVSTANLDRRSFELNFEVSTLVYDTDFASQLRLLQKTYLDGLRPIDSTRWHERGWPRRLVESLAGTLSPVL